MKIDIAMPYHGDRRKYVLELLNQIHSDQRIGQIVIVDDCSPMQDYAASKKAFERFEKVKMYRNEERLFVFGNKVRAVSLCKSRWVLLLDSDNFINRRALSVFFSIHLSSRVVYAPSMGVPRLDYREYAGLVLDAGNIAAYIDKPKMPMLLNTMNYFLPREMWLDAIKTQHEIGFEPLTADSIYINYLLFRAGMRLGVVQGLYYGHAVHGGSTFLSMQSQGIEISAMLEAKMRSMK